MKARDIGNNNCDIQEIEITNIRKVAICRDKSAESWPSMFVKEEQFCRFCVVGATD